MAIDLIARQQYTAMTLSAAKDANTAGGPQEKGRKTTRRTIGAAFQTLFEKESTQVTLASLTEIVGMGDGEAVETLKDRMDAAGENLANRGSSEDFAAYRKAVQHFVKYVVAKNLSVENSVVPGRPKRNDEGIMERKNRVYYRITVIDEKLDVLAAELLMNHTDKIGLLAKIDEIRGLVINLFS